MQSRYAGVKAAVTKAHNADYLESVGDYNSALECYKDAVELLIPLLEGTSVLHSSKAILYLIYYQSNECYIFVWSLSNLYLLSEGRFRG